MNQSARQIVSKTSLKLRPYDRYGTVTAGMDWQPISEDKATGECTFFLRFAPGISSQPHEHMAREEFRKHGHAVIDWIADYRARVEERPVMARTEPGEIRASLPAHPPERPEPFDAILRDLDAVIAPGLTHWQHPRFFGYFPSNGTLGSVLADFLSTGLGVIGLTWQSSPALTEVEEVATDWLRQMVGLPDGWRPNRRREA